MRHCLQLSSFLAGFLPSLAFFDFRFALVSAFSTTTNSATLSSRLGEDVLSCWEAELWEVAQPLLPAPADYAESLEILKRDGVVRLNPDMFRVNENLCADLRDRILAEITNPIPNDSKNADNFVDQYVPGTRLRPGVGAIDLAFAGDVRHDVLLPLKDESFSELRPVFESAARQLEPLLLVAAEQLLPRLHGSTDRGSTNSSQRISKMEKSKSRVEIEKNDDSSLSSVERQVLEKDLSVEVTEVSSLVVRPGSGHQGIHGDYRRFHEEDDDFKKEESLANTKNRDGKMPPRMVTFVALQDIPSDEHGSTGFITGTHNSQSHGLVYGESNVLDADRDTAEKNRQKVLNSSTSGVRTSCGFRRGEMLIYDASVLHWGGANSVPGNDRVMLYFGVSRRGAAAQLSENQPEPGNCEIISPILLRDFVAPP